MRFREFLRAFLKSLKSGRLHRVLKFSMVLLFLFFSYQVSVSIVKYWLKEKEELSVVKKNFRWGFNWKRGELSLEADYLFLENPKFSCELYKPELDVNVYRSFRELRPVFSFVGVSEGKLNLKRKGEKRKEFSFKLPFLVEKVDVGRFTVKWNGGGAVLGKFIYNERELQFGGLNGSIRGKEFYISSFSGVKKDGYFLIPDFYAGYGSSKLSGELKVYSLGNWWFSGSLFSSMFFGQITVKNYGKLDVSWKGKLKDLNTEGTAILRLKRGKVVLEKVSGKFDGADFSLKGEVGENVELKGTVRSKRFVYGNCRAEGVYLRVSAFGRLNDPEVNIRGNISALTAPKIELRKLEVNGNLNREKGKFKWSSESLGGEVSLAWKEKSAKGTVKLKSFELKQIPVVRVYRSKYRGWIPEVNLSGDLVFKVSDGRADYRGKLKVNRFNFQGFKASGTVQITGNGEVVKVEGELTGEKGGKTEGEAELHLKKMEIESFYTAESVPVEGFKFLEKVGLGGKVSGKGRVWGSLKNPRADFQVRSEDLRFKGVELGKSKGEVKLKDFVLSVRAITERGTLDRLSLRLKGKRKLYLKGKVNGVSGKEIEQILKGFRVKLPFKLDGKGEGAFSVYSENLKEKGSIQIKINVDSFSGVIKYDSLAAEGSGKGEVEYRNGYVIVNLSGELKRASFKGKVLNGGSYRVSYKGKELLVGLENSHYVSGVEGFENSLSGDVFIDFETGKLEGKGRVTGRYSLKEKGEVFGGVDYFLFGVLSRFTVKISGKLNWNSDITGKNEFKVEGAILEPDNLGTITVSGNNGTDLKVIANKDQWQVVGSVRNLNIKIPQVKAKINMAFVNVNVTTLTGTVAVPTFKVYPKGFYPLYSVSGIYANLKNGELQLSDVTLSYVDGWIRVKDLLFDREKNGLKGKVEARLGAKGLVYLVKAQRFVPYVRNELRVNGDFSYEGNLNYRVSVDGTGVEFRTEYLLDKAVVNSLKALVENGRLKEVESNISIGSGSILISGGEKETNVTVSLIPVGEVGKWKGLISGKLNYGEGGIKGNLTVSKAKLFIGKEEKKKRKSSEGAPRFPVNVDVNLLFDQPLKIKGELFSLTLIPKLWIKTVNERAVIGGTFYVTDGKIDYMGKEFKVIYGTGTIEDLEREKGRVNILASAYVSGYYIYMKIEGEFSNLTIYLSSDPPLTREQILNLIMTGASPEEIEASSELFPAVQVAYYATAFLFKPFETKFKETLKLESFSIEPHITKYGETVAKLTIAKRLAERIRLVGYGTTGQNPEYGGSFQFFLKKNYYLELRYNSYYGLEAGIGLEVNKR